MVNPTVSIVLPTFNGAKYIGQSIQSCLQQSYKDFELIIVNDCSTDNTLEIVNSFAARDNRIIVTSNAENLKLPLSLNAGFALARGKYFTWTSDDNYYAPAALATLVHELELSSETALIYTDYSLINESGSVFGERRFGDVNENFTNWLGCGACFLYKSEVHIKNKGYNPAAFLIEDYEFFMRAFIDFKFKYLPVTNLYFYREHEGSLTSRYAAIVNDMAKIFLERNLAALEGKLNKSDLVLLYRKLAVFYGATKTIPFKYNQYLLKLRSLSFAQMLLVLIYVPIIKMGQILQTIFVGTKSLFVSSPVQR